MEKKNRREIRCYDYVNHPYERVRDALLHDAVAIFQSATKSAVSRAQSVATELRVDVGGIGIKADAGPFMLGRGLAEHSFGRPMKWAFCMSVYDTDWRWIRLHLRRPLQRQRFLCSLYTGRATATYRLTILKTFKLHAPQRLSFGWFLKPTTAEPTASLLRNLIAGY